MEKGKKEFKILMWGPKDPVNVWTVSDHKIKDIVEEAVFTIRNSRPNEFIGFSVMRNMTPRELEKVIKKKEEKISIIS